MGVIIKQSIRGTIVNYVGVAIGMFTTFFIIAKYLTPAELGLTRTLVDAGLLFAGLAQLGTNTSIQRFFPYFKNPEQKDHGFFFWTLVIPIIGFILYLILLLLLKDPISNLFSKNSALFVDYFYFLIPLGFFILYQTVLETNSVVLLKIVVPVFVREVGIRLMLLITYLLFAFHFISLTGLVIGFCATYGIAALINLVYLISLNRISLKPDYKFVTKKLRKDFLFYTLFLIGGALTSAIVPSLGSFFISAKIGLAFTGVYAMARYIVAFIEIPYRSLGAISNPHVSQVVKDEDFSTVNKLIKKVSLHQFLAASSIFFIIWINIDLVYQLLENGKEYATGKWVVFILGISSIISTSVQIGSTVLGYSKYYYYSLLFTFVLTASAIVMNVIFIPILGINGAALATLTAYVIYNLLLNSLVYCKLGVTPISFKHLKVIITIAILFLLNFIFNKGIANFISSPIDSNIWVSFCDGLLRTLLLTAFGAIIIYKIQISEEINNLIRKYFLKIGIKLT